MQSWCAFEQAKEKISSSRIEILVEQTRTGARASLQSGNLVPSDCHWAVFLDDIVMGRRFYCSDSSMNMLLLGMDVGWQRERKGVSAAGDLHKRTFLTPRRTVSHGTNPTTNDLHGRTALSSFLFAWQQVHLHRCSSQTSGRSNFWRGV